MALAGNRVEVGFRDYLRVLRRRRWLIAAITVVSTIAGAAVVYRQIPIYQAAALVQMDPDPPKVISFQDPGPAGAASADYYLTQQALIRGRAVLEKAVEMANLKQRLPGAVSADDPSRFLVGSVSVVPRRGTRLVEIRYDGPDPAFAAEMANTVARAYIKHNLDAKLKGAQDAVAWLTEQMSGLQKKVHESSMALQNYRIKSGILGLGEQRQITTGKIMTFNNAYLDAQAQRLAIEAKLRQITEIARDPLGAQSIFTVADSAMIQKLRSEGQELEGQLTKLKQVYREKHPEVLKVQAQMALVQQKTESSIKNMLRAVQTELSVAKAREDALLRQLNELKKEGTALNETEIQYQAMAKEQETTQKMFDMVLQRLKETGITSGLETNNVRLVEDAQVPRAPIRPNRTASLGMSAGIGLFLGLCVAFVLEFMDNTIKTPDDVRRFLDVPVLGVVPTFESKR